MPDSPPPEQPPAPPRSRRAAWGIFALGAAFGGLAFWASARFGGGVWPALVAQRWVVAGGAAAGIALLWLLRQAADREARKRYGVLQWCLALSAALHLLAAFAFSLWVIAEAVVKADDEPMEVAVNPKALAKEKLALQIREEIAPLPEPTVTPDAAPALAPPDPAAVADAPADPLPRSADPADDFAPAPAPAVVPARSPDPAPAVEIAAEPLPAPAAMPQPEVAAAQPPPMLEERAAPAVAPDPAPEFAPPPAPAPPPALPAPMLAEPPALPVPDGADLPAADAPEITLPPPAPEPPALDAPALPLMAEAPAPPLPAPLAQPEAALPSPALEMRAPNAAPIPEPAADPEALESLLAAKPLEPSALLPAPAEVAALPPVAIAPPDQRTPRLPAPPPATAAAPIAALPEAESGAAAAAGALPDSPVAAPPPIPVAPGLSLESRPQALDPLALRREPNREQIIEQLGGSQDTERVIGKALDWFTRHQEADGRWDIARHGGKRDHDIAATGMALLCYMGWGSTHTGGGPHAEPLRKGIAWLAAQIGEGGELGGDRQTKGNMYDQGIATIALAEAYALTGDESLRPKVEAAAGFILRAQNGTGSWRYAGDRDGDTSIHGWQVLALKNAAMVGIAVPPEAFQNSARWLDRADGGKSGGLYGYQDRNPKPGLIAEGMFCRQLLGTPRTQPNMLESAAAIAERSPGKGTLDFYPLYYGTLALYQHGGPEWDAWNAALKPALLERQIKNGGNEGSWNPEGAFANEAGRLVTTAFAVLSLEVYYRYLPMYSR